MVHLYDLHSAARIEAIRLAFLIQRQNCNVPYHLSVYPLFQIDILHVTSHPYIDSARELIFLPHSHLNVMLREGE